MRTGAAIYTKMISRRSAIGLALAAAMPLTTREFVPLAAQDTAQGSWTFAGNAARTGEMPGPGLDFNREVVQLWTTAGSAPGILYDPCGVCDGIVYYLPVPDGISGEVRPLIALDAQTGAQLWEREPPISNPPTFFVGEPAIADGLLVMCTYSGLLVAMDAKTGEERWIFDLQGTANEYHPAIVDGVVYVSDGAAVNAVKLGDTPEWHWKTSRGDGVQTVVSPTVSVAGGLVVVSSVNPLPGSTLDEKDSTIHVLNTVDGTEAYRYQFQTGGEQYQFAVKDGMLYSRSDGAFLKRSFLFSMAIDGTYRWHIRSSTDPSYPAVTGDKVYIGASAAVFAMNPATGETVWQAPAPELLEPDLVIVEGVIYAGTTPPGQNIYAMSASDGSLLGSIAAGDRGSKVVGVTEGVLIARMGTNLAAYGNP